MMWTVSVLVFWIAGVVVTMVTIPILHRRHDWCDSSGGVTTEPGQNFFRHAHHRSRISQFLTQQQLQQSAGRDSLFCPPSVEPCSVKPLDARAPLQVTKDSHKSQSSFPGHSFSKLCGHQEAAPNKEGEGHEKFIRYGHWCIVLDRTYL